MSDETITIDKEQYDQFMSRLDGLLDSVFTCGYEDDVQKIDELRDDMEETAEVSEEDWTPQGYITWHDGVPDEFVDLVTESIDQSDFMRTRTAPSPDGMEQDYLVVSEKSTTCRSSRRSESESAKEEKQ